MDLRVCSLAMSNVAKIFTDGDYNWWFGYTSCSPSEIDMGSSECQVTIDTNKNFSNYRSTLASISPLAVPFIGATTLHKDVAERKLT